MYCVSVKQYTIQSTLEELNKGLEITDSSHREREVRGSECVNLVQLFLFHQLIDSIEINTTEEN